MPCFCRQGAREHKKLDPDATSEGRACAVQWSKEEFAKYGQNSKVASKIQEPAHTVTIIIALIVRSFFNHASGTLADWIMPGL